MDIISYKCSAACGDIIYTLPSVKQIYETTGKKGVYYINNKTYAKRQSVDTYQALKRLIEAQYYIKECLPCQGQKVDHDFDKFRKINYKNTPMPLVMAQAIGLKDVNYKDAWLDFEYDPCGYITFNVTSRYKNHGVDFDRLAMSMTIEYNELWFLGLNHEYLHSGMHKYCRFFKQSNNMYEAALYIASSDSVYCNQSAILTIAQGMNHPSIYLAKDKNFNNTVLGKETIL